MTDPSPRAPLPLPDTTPAGAMPYRITACDDVTPTIKELWRLPLENRLKSLPGEYVLLPRQMTPPINTKTGDDGTTGLLFGGPISKASAVTEVRGTPDEAIETLSVAPATLTDEHLRSLELERRLFAAGTQAAANPRARDRLAPGIPPVTVDITATLDQEIDQLLSEHPLRPAFAVPGGTPQSAMLDLARTFLRRWP